MRLYGTLTWRQRQAAKRCGKRDTISVTAAVDNVKDRANPHIPIPPLKRSCLIRFIQRTRLKLGAQAKETPACNKSVFPHLQWLWILSWSLQCALARGRSSTSSWQPGVTAIISHQMPTSVLWTCTYLQGKSVYLASFLSPWPYCQNRGIWSFPRMGPIVCSLIHTQFSPWAWMWKMKENYWKTKDN